MNIVLSSQGGDIEVISPSVTESGTVIVQTLIFPSLEKEKRKRKETKRKNQRKVKNKRKIK